MESIFSKQWLCLATVCIYNLVDVSECLLGDLHFVVVEINSLFINHFRLHCVMAALLIFILLLVIIFALLPKFQSALARKVSLF